jgi:UDP-perosamine 4-acetyltransferase
MAWLDDDADKIGSRVLDLPVDGPIEAALGRLPETVPVLVSLGDNGLRLRWLRRARLLGHPTPALVSPSAEVSARAAIGEACYVHAFSLVWTGASIGFGTILDPRSTVLHDTALGQGCFVGSGAVIGGAVDVGERAFFGLGSVVSTTVSRIGAGTMVGAGAVVIRDTEPGGVYVGCPARRVR